MFFSKCSSSVAASLSVCLDPRAGGAGCSGRGGNRGEGLSCGRASGGDGRSSWSGGNILPVARLYLGCYSSYFGLDLRQWWPDTPRSCCIFLKWKLLGRECLAQWCADSGLK